MRTFNSIYTELKAIDSELSAMRDVAPHGTKLKRDLADAHSKVASAWFTLFQMLPTEISGIHRETQSEKHYRETITGAKPEQTRKFCEWMKEKP
jgi:hypothetical protein